MYSEVIFKIEQYHPSVSAEQSWVKPKIHSVQLWPPVLSKSLGVVQLPHRGRWHPTCVLAHSVAFLCPVEYCPSPPAGVLTLLENASTPLALSD